MEWSTCRHILIRSHDLSTTGIHSLNSYCVCYAQSVDLHNPGIVLRKPWIHGLFAQVIHDLIVDTVIKNLPHTPIY